MPSDDAKYNLDESGSMAKSSAPQEQENELGKSLARSDLERWIAERG